MSFFGLGLGFWQLVLAALRAACRAAVGLAFLALTARLRRAALWGMAGFLGLLALIARLRRAELLGGMWLFFFFLGMAYWNFCQRGSEG